jgi:hypothetical protein
VAAVELAVVAPFLVFLFVVAVDFARVFYYAVAIDNCARNGAAFGSQTAGTPNWEGGAGQITSMQQAAVADGANLNPPVTADNVTVTNSTDADGNSCVVVTVNYTFSTLTNLPGVPSKVNLQRAAQMRIAP